MDADSRSSWLSSDSEDLTQLLWKRKTAANQRPFSMGNISLSNQLLDPTNTVTHPSCMIAERVSGTCT